MLTGHQQQTPLVNAFQRSAPQPKHGCKADDVALRIEPKRSFDPKPGR